MNEVVPRVSLIVALLGVSACQATTSEAPLESVDRDLRASEIDAYSRYKNKRLRTSGVVQELGVRAVDEYTAEHSWMQLKSTMHRSSVAYPFVQLRDSNAPGTRLLCYFEPDAIDELEGVKSGMLLKVAGNFQEHVKHADGSLMVVLSGCELDD